MAKIRRIYNPLDIAVTISAIESSLRQDYDVNYKRFTPDRRLVPTVVQPIVTLRDSAGLVDDGVINSKLIPESIKYYRTYYDAALGKSVKKEITNDINYTIDTTSNSDNRGRITIRQNFIQENTTTITFQATYIDYVNVGGTNKERRRASVSKSFTLVTDTLAQPEPLLIVDTPIGISYNPLKDLKWLNMVADLRVGQESIPSAYWWYKKDGAVETLLGEKYVGHNKRDIRIPSYEIGSKQDYVVKVQDCRTELEQLKNGYIDTEIAKNTITTPDGDIVLNNMTKNGDFRNGTTGWLFGPDVAERSVTDSILSFIGGGVLGSSHNWVRQHGTSDFPTGHILYNIATARSLMGATFYVGIGYIGSGFDLTDQWGTYSRLGSSTSANFPTYGAELDGTVEMTNAMCFDLTAIFGEGNEPTKEEMDTYLADKPFMANVEDVRAEADKLTLPEGYRPAPDIAKQKTAQLTLTTQYPEYDVRVVTDYGDDATVIEIPSNVYKFEAWVEIHTASGLLQNPQNYFDIDWGNDVNGNPQKGQKITVFSELLGLGIYNLEPTVTERVLNTSIMGKQTVVGARILRLSEYTDERPIPFNLKGLTAENYLPNGDFRDGINRWTIDNFDVVQSDGVLLQKNNNQRARFRQASVANLNETDIYYAFAIIQCSVIPPAASIIFGQTNASLVVNYLFHINASQNTDVQRLSLKGNIDLSGNYSTLGIAAKETYQGNIKVKHMSIINLTEIFGAGNEPTKEWCDEYFANYFEGAQSVDAPVRVKSVGKNLLIVENIGKGGLSLTGFVGEGNSFIADLQIGDPIIASFSSGYSGLNSGYIPIKKNINIVQKCTSTPSVHGYRMAVYDEDYNLLQVRNNSSSINTENGAYIVASLQVNYDGVVKFTNWQIEENSTSTPYEPYKESNLYIDNNINLRSLPNGVKDEIRSDGKGGYEMVKRVDDLGVELATPIIIPLLTSGSLISYPNGTVYVENVVANAGVYTDKFSVMDVDLEIKALESIAKIDYQTGEATQLDVSKAVLGDTFFTHPDLEDKDIVYVNYVYKHSNVYGEASVEYYNVID